MKKRPFTAIRKFFVILTQLTATTLYGQTPVQVPFGQGQLTVQPLNDNSVRIRYEEQRCRQLPEYIYVSTATARYDVSHTGDRCDISTPKMRVSIDQKSQRIRISDATGREVFAAGKHLLQPVAFDGEQAYRATLIFDTPQDEHLYGLGQFQDGYTDVRGLSRRLTQVNTQISIPMLLSSRGYGLLWNQYGLTEYNPGTDSLRLEKQTTGQQQQEVVDVTSTEGNKREVRERHLFEGTIDIAEEGDYSLLLDVGQKMARRHDLRIDGEPVIHMQNIWLPPTASAIVHLSAGRHHLSAELEKDDRPTLFYRRVTDKTVLRSQLATAVDYTVFVGTADDVIASYRQLTGAAPLMPKWALGYIHCRERFHSQQEILSTAQRFRSERLPVDVLVQDWQYWGKHGWNAMLFDEEHYPDPAQLVDSLHGMNMRLMLSVWSKIDPNSALGREMKAAGHYIPGTEWIDFFDKEASQAYWDAFSHRLLRPYHIDAWWQDATEPENDDLTGRRIMRGKLAGEWLRNAYPLMVNKTVYEGCRRDDPGRRTMILTRCGYPGIQRYGAAMWSGDVGNDWETLRRQISAGLGMMAAGMPWWTYDAGGFFRPRNQYQDADYIERMLRWIEASVYLPLMRVHGYQSDTEPWRYGDEAQQVIAQCLRERYRLLPYIYSNAAEVTFEGGTLMRPLVFDFAHDEKALEASGTYLFGRALLVHPVTEAHVSTWRTYLPQNAGGWYDYRTNRHYEGGQFIDSPVTLSTIPVFARGGSIVVLGGDRQYATEAIDNTLEIRVYPGSDADFTLYDDDGVSYAYEQGNKTLVRLHWNDSRQELTIGPREGTYTSKNRQLLIRVLLPDGRSKTVKYRGKGLRFEI